MRRVLTLALCGLCLAFGSVAGRAHVHGAAGHLEESRELHFNHAHLDHHGDHAHGDARLDILHGDDHAGDAVYLSGSVIRVFPNVRVLPLLVSAGSAIERPSLASKTEDVRPGQPRDPPKNFPPRLRAPPA